MIQELVGVEVYSKQYGKGKIIDTIEDKFVVSFEAATKTYLYPLAFEKGLDVDPEIKMKAMNLLNARRKKAEEVKQRPEEGKPQIVAVKQPTKEIRFNGGIFKSDYNLEYLQRQPILPYDEVERQFGIKLTGFGRGINTSRLNSNIVLISVISKDHGFFVYHDHWTPEGNYIYSGEGKKGDQSLNRGNLAIVNAKAEHKTLHLFVKFSPQQYYYQGIFELIDYTYEDDFGEDGKIRKEFKFRLRKSM